MYSTTKVEKFEPETTFDNNIDNIKDDHIIITTSLGMNISAITSNKYSSTFGDIKTNIMTWILLKLPGKSPQFTNHLTSMHLEGNTQPKIRKWWVTIR